MLILLFTTHKPPYPKKDEIPFEIPESWVWVRLGDVVFDLGQKKPTSAFYYIDVSSIDNKKHILSDNFNIILPQDAPSRARKIVTQGTILYSTVRPYLQNICIIENEKEYEFIASTAFATMNTYSYLSNQYLFYYLLSPLFTKFVSEKMIGVAYPAINDSTLYNLFVPLPPLNEQKRIVEQIEKLLPFIEQYDEKEQQLTALNQQFPEQLKKSILQSAIQGKLVPQNPNDEPASELIKRIQQEKKRLISAKKLKKPKSVSEIIVRDNLPYEIINGVERCIADEVPFEIPENWAWVRLSDIGEIVGGGTPKTTENKNWINGNIPWVTPADMKYVQGKFIKNGTRSITLLGLNSCSAKVLSKNSIIYSSRAPIGYIAITENELCTNQGFKSIDFYYKSIVNYIYYSLIAFTPEIQSRASGTTFKEISGMEFGKTIIPLPPLNEQKRIIEKIESLFSILQNLK